MEARDGEAAKERETMEEMYKQARGEGGPCLANSRCLEAWLAWQTFLAYQISNTCKWPAICASRQAC